VLESVAQLTQQLSLFRLGRSGPIGAPVEPADVVVAPALVAPALGVPVLAQVLAALALEPAVPVRVAATVARVQGTKEINRHAGCLRAHFPLPLEADAKPRSPEPARDVFLVAKEPLCVN
jgi:hypothetical protein